MAHCEAPDSPANLRYAGGRGAERHKVNSHSNFDGDNAQARTRLGTDVWAEFDRIANAHHAMFEEMGLPWVGQKPKAP